MPPEKNACGVRFVAERPRHFTPLRLRADQAAAARARLGEVVDEGHEARDASPARSTTSAPDSD